MRKRTQSLKKYGISPKRYKELCGFCEQYGEWKDELKSLDNPLKSPKYDGMPHGKGNTSDPTFALATKRTMLKEKIELVEQCAKEADPEFWQEIIKSACYEKPYNYLYTVCHMPLGIDAFYERRRYFFYVLSQKR